MPPSGKYSPHIAPVDAMVINFGLKIDLWHCAIAFQSWHLKALNRPFTQLIEAISCVERTNAKIEAEELSNFSSYQTLTTNRNW
jgi:hypothetical protein